MMNMSLADMRDIGIKTYSSIIPEPYEICK